jgi:hypothetical protein
MEKFIFAIHSMVDVITNSSTELFIIDSEQELALIEAIIREKEKEFPTEYGNRVYVSKTDEWEIKDMFNYPDEDEAVKYLKALGYTIEKPAEPKLAMRYISISCEQGCMHPGLKKFIRETFNVVDED